MKYLADLALTVFIFGASAGYAEKAKMIPYVHDSRSKILSSKTIFSFLIESITPTFPVEDMPTGHNIWNFKGKILKKIKGEIAEKEDSLFSTSVSIYFGPVRARPGGLWINESPANGSSWVLFCNELKWSSASDLIKDKAIGCSAFHLNEVRADLQLSERVVQEQMNFDQALQETKKEIQKLDYFFMCFFVDTFSKTLTNDFSAFNKAIELLDSLPANSASAYVLRSDLDSVIMSQPDTAASDKMAYRFIVSCFLAAGKNSHHAENILATTLTNWVGIEGGMKKHSAIEVFKDYPKEKVETEHMLTNSKYKKPAAVLLAWLHGAKSK